MAPPAKKPPATDPAADPTKTKDPKPAATTPTDGGFTTGGGSPSSTATLATATSIAVNGVAEDVTVEVPFPVSEPTFVLVSIAKDGKSVEIGVDGGEYASGGETLKLLLGKKLTLQNTADGSRYELELLSIKGSRCPSRRGRSLEKRRLSADAPVVIARLRSEEGFGLIELVISMVMLNVGILAIVTAFNSGAVALKQASEVSSASVLADKQMELYRALKYAEIALDSTSVTTANTDTTYQCDYANRVDCRRRLRRCQPADAAAHDLRDHDAGVQSPSDGSRAGQALVPGRHVHRRADSSDGPREQARHDRHPPRFRPPRARAGVVVVRPVHRLVELLTR